MDVDNLVHVDAYKALILASSSFYSKRIRRRLCRIILYTFHEPLNIIYPPLEICYTGV